MGSSSEGAVGTGSSVTLVVGEHGAMTLSKDSHKHFLRRSESDLDDPSYLNNRDLSRHPFFTSVDSFHDPGRIAKTV